MHLSALSMDFFTISGIPEPSSRPGFGKTLVTSGQKSSPSRTLSSVWPISAELHEGHFRRYVPTFQSANTSCSWDAITSASTLDVHSSHSISTQSLQKRCHVPKRSKIKNGHVIVNPRSSVEATEITQESHRLRIFERCIASPITYDIAFILINCATQAVSLTIFLPITPPSAMRSLRFSFSKRCRLFVRIGVVSDFKINA